MAYLQQLLTTIKGIPLNVLVAFTVCIPIMLLANSEAISTVESGYFQPLPSSNKNPLVQVHDIPEASGTFTVPKTKIQWSSIIDMASISSQSLGSSTRNSNQTHESLLLDGETYRTAIRIRYGLSDQSDLSMTIPLIAHAGGFADSAISSWHDTFGLPNESRAIRPTNALDYRYQRNGENILAFNQSTEGLGDIRLDYRHRISNSDERRDKNRINRLIQVSAKLPTGSQNRLTGSGATTLSSSLQLGQLQMANTENWSWHASVGVLWISGGGLLSEINKQWAAYGSGGLNWQATNDIAIKIQLESHTAIYDSNTDELGHTAGQLAIGLSAKVNPNTVVDIYFTEDIVLNSSPDIGIGLAIHRYIEGRSKH
ncbi:DUF3187 family protein [Pseudomonadales bacterium]|nr:DUF3187 family protein [Pseudomonadales bacterium]